MKTRNPSHQTSPGLEARSCFSPGSLPPVKTSFIIEAETVNTGTKFIIRDVAQQEVGQYIEKLLVETEARPRHTLRKKECGRSSK